MEAQDSDPRRSDIFSHSYACSSLPRDFSMIDVSTPNYNQWTMSHTATAEVRFQAMGNAAPS